MSTKADEETQKKLWLEIWKTKESKRIADEHYDEWYLDYINHWDFNCKCVRCTEAKKQWR